MMISSIRRLCAVLIISLTFLAADAQPTVENPPYKVITSGKKITIKSSKAIQHVMIWTTDGNRVAEHKEINSTSFSLYLPVSQKNVFLMVGLNNGKVYTEKLAIQ